MPSTGVDDVTAARRAPFGDNPAVGERGRRTQAGLLDAAVTVFAEVGYPSARIEQITERAGCARPTFYQYFSSKEELFGRLAGRLGADLTALTEEAGPVDGSPAGRAAAAGWTRRLIELHRDHRVVFDAFRAALRGGPAMRAGAEDLTRRYGKALAAGAPEGRNDPLVATLTLTSLTGALSLVPPPVDGERRGTSRVEGLADVLVRALAGPPDDPGPAVADREESTASGPVSLPGRATGAHADLLAAAAAVFPRLGYEATRVDDLVAACGLAHGTFYRYFDDKADAFEQAAALAAGATFARMSDLTGAVTSGDVRGWTRRWFDTYLAHGAILGVWAENPRDEAGFSAAMTADAVTRLRPVAHGTEGVLALLSLLQWAPSLVQLFEGFEREATEAATALLVQRLTGPGGTS